MRWPFGPPHLTLKPSQKNKQKQTKTKQKQNKTTKKKPRKKSKKHKNTKKKSFSVISQFFLTGCPKIAFFDTLAQKTRTQKHYKIGVSAYFLEKSYASRNGHFWKKKKPKFRNSSYHFFSFKNKQHKNLLKPLFYSVLANLKKRIFQKLT